LLIQDFNVVNPSNNTLNRQKIIITIFVNEAKCILEKNLKNKHSKIVNFVTILLAIQVLKFHTFDGVKSPNDLPCRDISVKGEQMRHVVKHGSEKIWLLSFAKQ
jgi:hypothetical protein